jgi:hypothetical protein
MWPLFFARKEEKPVFFMAKNRWTHECYYTKSSGKKAEDQTPWNPGSVVRLLISGW